jgi:hypothetical protein
VRKCKSCGSQMVVGFPGYERCLCCHACWTEENGKWRRISDTPRNFRIFPEDDE